jgi:hypothetical protein
LESRGQAEKGSPRRVKWLILQGFIPPAGIAKKALLGYNISYFLRAVFRTGKYPVTA